jgi:apoptosis-inducing factor 3
MSEIDSSLPGPDLRNEGATIAEIPDGGMLVGHFDGAGVILVRKAGTIYGVGATCTHYGGPIGAGLFDGEVLRCPWHHACFQPETGEAIRAPAINPLASFAVDQRGARVFVTGKRETEVEQPKLPTSPNAIVVVGGGAAGFAAVAALRREGYGGPVTLVSAEGAAPYDRPAISKNYLAGSISEAQLQLRSPEWYVANNIALLLGRRVVELYPAERRVRLDDGRDLSYGALLLATGATPVHLDLQGADLPHVHYLRTLDDSREIVAGAERSQRAVVIGASFIGLEVAASLATRNLEVHVVAPGTVPMQAALGPDLGTFVRSLHEGHGVRFHLGQTVTQIDEGSVTLQDGSRLAAELVVLGVGVRPDLQLAEQAGLAVDKGVLVDEYLRTSAPEIWAAGDIARWPDPYTGEPIRVEHWVVAQRQGQTAALNMLGLSQRFDAVPFFWSRHYDVRINYVGHAQSWDQIGIAGSIDHDCLVSYRNGGKTLGVASLLRDQQSLEAEMAFERCDAGILETLATGNIAQG